MDKGMIFEATGKWILVLLILVVMLIAIVVIKGNLTDQWNYLKNLFIFGG